MSDRLKTAFSGFGNEIVAKLRASLREKDMFVTGKTSASLRFEAEKDGFRVIAPGYIDDLESGVRPGTQANLSDLAAWIQARGIADRFSAKGLSTLLTSRGSRLYRGVDPRFRGKKSGAISDVINEAESKKLVNSVREIISDEAAQEIRVTLQDTIRN